MDFLDRYLEAVRRHLPWQRQDDIIAELRGNLEAQLEEKEAVLGRPLTQAEADAWLKQLGSPMQMAAPYQPQQYLIGPVMFPIYRHVLKLACSWGTMIYSIATVATMFAGHDASASALLLALLRLPGVLLMIAAWVTLVFAAIEFAVTHGYLPAEKLEPFSKGWAPSMLPHIDMQADGGKKRKSFSHAVIEVVFHVFFLGWLLLVPQHPWMLFGPGAAMLDASPYQLAPVWMQFYWCVVALNVLQAGWDVERLARGRWQRPQRIRHIVYKSLGLCACVVVLAARDHVTILLRHPALDQARYGTQLDAINQYVHLSFLVIAAIAAVQLAWDLVQLSVNASRKRAAAMQ